MDIIDAINGCAHESFLLVLESDKGFSSISQKDGVVFQGTDSRNLATGRGKKQGYRYNFYNKLGLAEYEVMEAFVRWLFKAYNFKLPIINRLPHKIFLECQKFLL